MRTHVINVRSADEDDDDVDRPSHDDAAVPPLIDVNDHHQQQEMTPTPKFAQWASIMPSPSGGFAFNDECTDTEPPISAMMSNDPNQPQPPQEQQQDTAVDNDEDDDVTAGMSTCYVVGIWIGYILVNSATSLSQKWMTSTKAPKFAGGSLKKFNHPYPNALLGVAVEALVLLVHYIKNILKEARGEELVEVIDYASDEVSIPMVIVTGVLRAAASFLIQIGFSTTVLSDFSLLLSFQTLWTAFIARVIMKKSFFNFQYLGITVVFAGLMLSFAASLVDAAPASESAPSPTDRAIGNVLVIVGTVLQAATNNIQDRIIKQGIPSLQLVSLSSVVATPIVLAGLLIMEWIPNSPSSMRQWAYQLSHGGWDVPVSFTLWMLVVFAGPLFGAWVMEISSATQRRVISLARTFVVWGVTQIFHDYYGESFSWIQLAGLIVLLVGLAVYNYIVVLPCDSMKKVDAEESGVENENVNDDTDRVFLVAADEIGQEEAHRLECANEALPARQRRLSSVSLSFLSLIVQRREQRFQCVRKAASKWLAMIGRVPACPTITAVEFNAAKRAAETLAGTPRSRKNSVFIRVNSAIMACVRHTRRFSSVKLQAPDLG